MPNEVAVTGTQGELHLTELRDDLYEPVAIADDASKTLRFGVELRERGEACRWRWTLGGRPLYVLAPAEEFGLHGFVSTARLWVNASHTILATADLLHDVLAAITAAGCANPEISDEKTPGVPRGWIVLREVTPTSPVPMRDGHDILNALCPAHEIQPHFVGGIRLERNTWLTGFPPRIRLTGELGNGFQVMIDGRPARPAADGAFETLGWDAEGDHQLGFGDRTETYSLRTMDEDWGGWPAYSFGVGTSICGAGLHRREGANWCQIRVPTSNPILLGSRPGEVFCCRARPDVHSETILALVPFAPVWALPLDPAHADKHSARIVLMDPKLPVSAAAREHLNRSKERSLAAWITAINTAGRKHLVLAGGDEGAAVLWGQYRALSRRLWRSMR
jgi:hypothetical protein